MSAATANSSQPVLQRFADYAVSLHEHPLPGDVLHHARRALIDWHAAALPGALLPPATLLEKALVDELDRGKAALVLGRSATVRAAALINGTAAHVLEVDDIFRDAIFHPGAPAIAAALAVAQAEGADGTALLRAIVAGYEISTRIGVAMGRQHYAYWHTTGTVGSFGAAAAAGMLLKLTRVQMQHALATVATFAAGLQQAFRSDSLSKPLHAGRAAEAGVFAALAAQAGVTGTADMLEGSDGFGRAMGERTGAGPDWQAATANLGKVFNITAMTFKNHVCCGHTFAAIDGALLLKERMHLNADDVARVRIATYGEALAVADNRDASTPALAKFSLAYVVAHALTYGSVRLAAYTPQRLADPALRALMQRIETVLDPELDAAFPGRRAARVTLDAKDGHSECWLQPTRKGDPEAPLTDAELEAKFLEFVVPVTGEAKAKALAGQLWNIDRVKGRVVDGLRLQPAA
jgi:2-methylcitrate dehydratase PrpD